MADVFPSFSPFTVEKSDAFSCNEIKLFLDSEIAFDELLSISFISSSAFYFF